MNNHALRNIAGMFCIVVCCMWAWLCYRTFFSHSFSAMNVKVTLRLSAEPVCFLICGRVVSLLIEPTVHVIKEEFKTSHSSSACVARRNKCGRL